MGADARGLASLGPDGVRSAFETRQSGMRVSAVTAVADLPAIAPAWRALLHGVRADTIFLTPEWQIAWTREFLEPDRRLLLLLVRRNGDLVGIAPWCVRRVRGRAGVVRRLEFLGSPEAGSDYLDAVVRPGMEREVADALFGYLFGEAASTWDTLLFRDVLAESLFLLHFVNALERSGKYLEVRLGAFCPVLALPSTAGELEAQLSPSRRQRIARYRRMLGEAGPVRHRVVGTRSGEDPVSAYADLARRLGTGDTALAAPLERFLRGFAVATASEGRVECDVLEVADRPVGAFLHLRYRDALLLYLVAVDKRFDRRVSLGTVLIAASLERAVEEGVSHYDFLKGDEPYKFQWAESGRRALTLACAQRRVGALLWVGERMARQLGRLVVRG